jgi:hypothetical protein
VAYPCDLYITEGLELAAPGVAIADVPFVKGVIERGLEYRQNAIGGGVAAAHVLGGNWCWLVLRLPALGPALRRRCGHGREPCAQTCGCQFRHDQITQGRQDMHGAAVAPL